MKKLIACLLLITIVLVAFPVLADENAAPLEVYEKVLQAAEVISVLGEKGLEAFNDPKGEFVRKNTYVWVLHCDKWTDAAHPFNPNLVGMDLKDLKCKKTGKLFFQEMCEGRKSEKGVWVEYWWPKPGEPEDKLFRKIAFVLQVPNSPYQVAAGIYNEDVSLEELNKSK